MAKRSKRGATFDLINPKDGGREDDRSDDESSTPMVADATVLASRSIASGGRRKARRTASTVTPSVPISALPGGGLFSNIALVQPSPTTTSTSSAASFNLNTQAVNTDIAAKYAALVIERDELLRTNSLISSDLDALREYVATHVQGDVTLFTINFEDEVGRQLQTLFNMMDANGSGHITEADFTNPNLSTGLTGAVNTMWEQVRTHLDLDGDNEIFFDEFVRAWAIIIGREVVNVNTHSTFAEYLKKINDTVQSVSKTRILNTATQVIGALKRNQVQKQSATTPQVTASPLVNKGYLRKDISVLLAKTFKHLQKSNTENFITAESFQRAGANVSDWLNVQKYFDADQSNTIDEAEFLDGFKRWIAHETILITAGSRTLAGLMHEVSDRASTLIRQKLLEFETRRRRSELISPQRTLSQPASTTTSSNVVQRNTSDPSFNM
eukprot:m.108373 g.108373  ORF g.108373 m.108373 type:complete len:441 (+) comp27870_c0_seq1:20-1342(+)